jgi:hypothetical protein
MTLVVDRRDAPASNVDGQSISITLWTTQRSWGPSSCRSSSRSRARTRA